MQSEVPKSYTTCEKHVDAGTEDAIHYACTFDWRS